ncbi:hypothetical protein CJ030_MR8G010077 [Morella rubra]|uniref:Uncharacterized protein n=1 Tax=Morella rubra TaxID=262757 RepID=A0A6A1UPT0_9ROSI|nr:hypothetical protein CJ030_MR8G010077 [Morella rubra]
MASRTLSNAGYNHYEISSYCKEGFSRKHNLAYWKNKPFYGFGLGSASYVGGLRFSRPAKMREHLGYVHNLENGVVDCRGNDCIEAKDTAMDVVMLSLRTARGLDLKSFGEAYVPLKVIDLGFIIQMLIKEACVEQTASYRTACSLLMSKHLSCE